MDSVFYLVFYSERLEPFALTRNFSLSRLQSDQIQAHCRVISRLNKGLSWGAGRVPPQVLVDNPPQSAFFFKKRKIVGLKKQKQNTFDF